MVHGKLHSTAEVASQLGVSVRRVRQIAKSMEVGQNISGRLVFTDADIDAMRNRRTQPGPHPRIEKPPQPEG